MRRSGHTVLCGEELILDYCEVVEFERERESL
jgi:hypothetical protein